MLCVYDNPPTHNQLIRIVYILFANAEFKVALPTMCNRLRAVWASNETMRGNVRNIATLCRIRIVSTYHNVSTERDSAGGSEDRKSFEFLTTKLEGLRNLSMGGPNEPTAFWQCPPEAPLLVEPLYEKSWVSGGRGFFLGILSHLEPKWIYFQTPDDSPTPPPIFKYPNQNCEFNNSCFPTQFMLCVYDNPPTHNQLIRIVYILFANAEFKVALPTMCNRLRAVWASNETMRGNVRNIATLCRIRIVSTYHNVSTERDSAGGSEDRKSFEFLTTKLEGLRNLSMGGPNEPTAFWQCPPESILLRTRLCRGSLSAGYFIMIIESIILFYSIVIVVTIDG